MNLMVLFYIQPRQFDSAYKACVMYNSLRGYSYVSVQNQKQHWERNYTLRNEHTIVPAKTVHCVCQID